jgi:hypothetical protein
MSQQAYSVTMFEDEEISAGGTATSPEIDVNSMRPLGNFASQLKVTGSGTVTLDLYLSINGDDYVNYYSLYEDQGATAGMIENHAFAVCTKFKVVATETSGADSATVSHWIGVQ